MKKQFLMRLFLVLSLLLTSMPSSWAKPKHLLLVTVTYGFPHSSIPTAENVLTVLGVQSGLFTVDIVRSGPRPKDKAEEAKWEDTARRALAEKMSVDALKQYDGVIFANTTGDLPLPDKDAFIQWIKSGKAFIGMHSCSDTFHEYPPFIEMLGGEFLTHHAQARVDCLNQDPRHPATLHFGPAFNILDEIYLLKNFRRDGVHGLLTLDKHPNTGMPGDFPIAWCKTFGKGKIFYTSLGHREDVWTNDAYQKHLLGGIKWALGLESGNSTPQGTEVKLAATEIKDGFRPLFNGANLAGWELRRSDGRPSWVVENGMLVNTVDKEHGTDLVSEEKFRDFTVRYEYMIPKGANSGFYLRGRYELQIFDDFESRKALPGGNGAVYSLKPVSLFASRAPGEWQQVEATIRGNRVTVILNGVIVHENVEVTRATGGELDANLNDPGPILLQGDHGTVAFRNIRIKPVK
ncbi:MAG: family 16 glycoside hydrolase [Verrucomicrobiota bacterium]